MKVSGLFKNFFAGILKFMNAKIRISFLAFLGFFCLHTVRAEDKACVEWSKMSLNKLGPLPSPWHLCSFVPAALKTAAVDDAAALILHIDRFIDVEAQRDIPMLIRISMSEPDAASKTKAEVASKHAATAAVLIKGFEKASTLCAGPKNPKCKFIVDQNVFRDKSLPGKQKRLLSELMNKFKQGMGKQALPENFETSMTKIANEAIFDVYSKQLAVK